MNRTLTISTNLMILAGLTALFACVGPPTEGRLVRVVLRVERAAAEASARKRSDGWSIELEEAKLALGPVYLRAPKRERQSAWRALFLPLAHAHPEHAQTLTEGQVMGEYLGQAVFDALSSDPAELGTCTAQVGPVERLSVVLDAPRSAEVERALGGKHALVRGRAEKAGKTVPFSCGLAIATDADEPPKNLEARRRVDQIRLDEVNAMLEEGSELVLRVHLERWLELVDFDAFEPGIDPCGGDGLFESQWYLGLRRPEAFSAMLLPREESP